MPRAIRDRVRGLRGLFLAEPEDLSLLALVDFMAADPMNGQADGSLRIATGNDSLATALALRLRGTVRTGVILRGVRQTAKGVAVVLDTSDRLSEWRGDYLVCALPASTARDVVFTPALPEVQAEAMRRLRYGAATRVLLQFDRRFWRRAGRPRAFASTQPHGAVWDGNEQQRGRRGILSLLAGGAAAGQLAGLADREGPVGVAQSLAWLGRPATIIHSRIIRWDEDPWAKGGYAFFDPGFDPRWRDVLAHPSGRIVFCGEHTSVRWQGYMNGAVESGRRAASELAALAADTAGPRG